MSVAAGSVSHPLYARTDEAQSIRASLERGQYDDAERGAAAWVKRVEQSQAPRSLELARALDVFVEALLKNGRAAEARTLNLADRALALKRTLVPASAADVAASLDNVAAVHDARGEFDQSLALEEKALAMVRRSRGEDNPAYADRLDAAAQTLVEMQKFDRARSMVDQSLRIRAHQSAESRLAYARTLEVSARLDQAEGRYPPSADALDRALEIWDREAPRHPDKATTLALRALTFFLMGQVAPASRMWSDAYALAKASLRPDHPSIALVARLAANGPFALGDLPEATRLREEAEQIGERSLPQCSPEVRNELTDLANSRQSDGRYEDASTLYRRQLSVIEKCSGPNHVDAATALYNQFVLLDRMGSPREAETLAIRAIRIWRARLGPDHPYLAFGLNGFAEFLSARKEYARAQEMFQRALAIRQRAFGAGHPALAETLEGLAETLAATGRGKDAVQKADEAIGILQNNPAWHPGSLANALEFRAELEQRQGDYRGARATLGRALAERERVYGSTNPVTARTHATLAAMDFALGSPVDALASALDAESSGRTLLLFNARSLPERRALELASARPRGLDLALSIAATHAASGHESEIADAVIRSRGVVLDELAARARSAATRDGEATGQALAGARARFATLMMRAATGTIVDAAVLDEARRAAEDAEEAAAVRSVTTGAELARAQIGIADVRRVLPSDGALVSFVRYERTTFASHKARLVPRRAPSYMALVLRNDVSEPAVVPLGTAAAIDAAIRRWRQEVDRGDSGDADADRTYRIAGTHLRRLVWDPLTNALRGTTRVFIVPDGAINTVSFAALPASPSGFLIDHAPVLHYLTTERDLVPDDSAALGAGLLAIGGPEYGSTPRVSEALASTGCGPGPLRFEPLPASMTEAREVARIAASTPTSILTGRAATKDAVARAAEGRRIVHLATHGFFLSGGCEPGGSNRRGVGGLVSLSGRMSRDAENPLLLAGLAFAGANGGSRSSTRGTGLLTAEEVVSLNLQGTEWVVLSACDTGLGEIEAGEGVFGLRRAFQIAGARTVIMSLWSVEDESTREWMRALYEARFRNHQTTADAVRSAMLRTLNDRRRRGLSTHPFYWAGFIAAGDWR